MTISEKIQFYRKSAGLSQEELAKSLLVSRQTISLWENGQTLPTIDNLIRLRELFGISLDEMICSEVSALEEKSAEHFEESYVCDTPISEIKRATLSPALITLSSLVILLFYIFAYGIYTHRDGIVLDIVLLLLATVTLTAVVLYTTYVLRSLKKKDKSSFTELKINSDALVIKNVHQGTETLISRSSHEAVRTEAISKNIIKISTKDTSIYINKKSIPPQSRILQFKKRTVYAKYALITALTVTLLFIGIGTVDIARSAPLARVERYSDLDIPKYTGIYENSSIGLINGVYVEYAADIFLDAASASELEDAMDGNTKWKIYNEADIESPLIPATISYSGAEYFLHNEYSSGKHVFLFYFEDENMMKAILLRNDA